jgi:hypothetical protein
LNDFCEENEYQIEYVLQPPNSPDLNILDLCLFNSLQMRSNKIKTSSKNAIDLINNVKVVFDTMDRETVCVTYGHLFACYNEVLKSYGDNSYKSPHKKVRERYNNDPNTLLNIVEISYDEIEALDNYVENWLNHNQQEQAY